MNHDDIVNHLNDCLKLRLNDIKEEKETHLQSIKESLQEIEDYVNAPIPLELVEMANNINKKLEVWNRARWLRMTTKFTVLFIVLAVLLQGCSYTWAYLQWVNCYMQMPIYSTTEQNVKRCDKYNIGRWNWKNYGDN